MAARSSQLEPLDAVRERAPVEILDDCDLGPVRRDDELPEPPMRDSLRLTPGVERTSPGDAERGLQAVRGVVDAGVDDFAVAARDAAGDARLGLRGRAPSGPPKQRPRHSQPDDTGSDDDDVEARAVGAARQRLSPNSPR